jgi:hypothetical protein
MTCHPKARVQCFGSPFGVCGGQIALAPFLSEHFYFSRSVIMPPLLHTHFHHLTLKGPQHTMMAMECSTPPHCYNCFAHYNRYAYTQHSWPGNKPSPPAQQTLQSAINITSKIFIFADASHEYLPTHVLQAFLIETRNRVGNSTIYDDSIANHLDVQ